MGADIQFQAVKCNVCILVGGNKFGMGDIVGIVWGAVEIKLCTDGAPYDADYISHTEFVSSDQDAHVAFDGLKLDIRTHNLPVYALWSDRNGQYTCASWSEETNSVWEI